MVPFHENPLSLNTFPMPSFHLRKFDSRLAAAATNSPPGGPSQEGLDLPPTVIATGLGKRRHFQLVPVVAKYIQL